MEDLEDDLDLRYHKGLDPDCYYRCPTTESLDGALRNEVERSASSLIPTEIVTEFIFAATSSITVPVTLQAQLESLIEPTDFLQSITVEHALCRETDGKDRLKVQRAFARSIIEAIQNSDGYKYVERHAQSKEGGDGTRLKYVCADSLQKRKSNKKKGGGQKNKEYDESNTETESAQPPAFDCGGAIHVKFSLKRGAINVVYRHNPLHPRFVCDLPALATEPLVSSKAPPEAANGKKNRKRKNVTKDEVKVDDDFRSADLDMSTSPEAPRSLTRKRKGPSGLINSPESGRKSNVKRLKRSKTPQSPSKSRKKATFQKASPPPSPSRLVKGKACLRCREKKIKCDEAKPACNQCRRGLWTCQYGTLGAKKRSKHGCSNCKQRKQKCPEERPSCAHCLRLDEDCEYGEDS